MSDVLGEAGDWEPERYALSAAVYLERDGQILLLQRAGGTALSGQWYLPGGAVDHGELPEDAARRELMEEAGLAVEGDLELVGAFPMWVYGGLALQLTYRGRAADGEVVLSHEHGAAQWVDPVDMRALLTDEFVEAVANGDERVVSLLHHIRDDLDRYLKRIGRGAGEGGSG
jgi:8-oxo-dGTP pyrophosphatase MutT (NUDIX family)